MRNDMCMICRRIFLCESDEIQFICPDCKKALERGENIRFINEKRMAKMLEKWVSTGASKNESFAQWIKSTKKRRVIYE